MEPSEPMAGDRHVPARDPDKAKAEIARVFSETAATHDAVGTPLFAHLGRELVDRLDLAGNEQVLDLGAGTGATLIPLARRLVNGGAVVGVDLAPGMVARLQEEIARRHLLNAQASVADAEALPFSDASLDVVVCGFGLFFFPDLPHALAELHRVLRPGGVLAVSTFTQAGSASMDRIWALIGTHAAVPEPAPAEQRLDRPRQLRSVLKAGGFAAIHVETVPFEMVLRTFDEWWAWVWSMEFRDTLAVMSPPDLEHFKRFAAARLTGGATDAPIRFPMNALFTFARKP